jgi:hypothetical protein
MPRNTERASPREELARNAQIAAKVTERDSVLTVARAADRRPSSAFERVLGALERYGSRVTGTGRQRAAQCPAHDDRTPSLSVTDGNDRVLIRCHAGCDTDDVLAEVGLTRADLFDSDERYPQHRGGDDNWTPRGPATDVYSYTDERGEVLFQVCRTADKQFPQRRPEPTSCTGWRWSGISDVRHVVYRLPAVLAAPAAACIFIAEGEKDVHALEAAGQIATCSPGGAGKWRDEYAATFAGRDVLIIADRDEPHERTGLRAGAEHAWDAYTSVQPVARFAWIVQAAAGKDAADHLAAGHDVTDFVWWEL